MGSTSTPRARAKSRRDARTASGSGEWVKPMVPRAVVEKPCTRPASVASSGIVSSCGMGPMPRSLRAARAQYLFDLALDLLQVHELPVHGRKADVRDLVQVAEAVHHHLADLPARDLDPSGAPELGLDVIHDGAQPLRRDVSLL